MDVWPGIFANMLASDDLVTKADLEVSSIITAYLRDRDLTPSTDVFHVVVRVLDDVAITPDDVLFLVIGSNIIYRRRLGACWRRTEDLAADLGGLY
jgi:hypothetical protein